MKTKRKMQNKKLWKKPKLISIYIATNTLLGGNTGPQDGETTFETGTLS
jgi:hypothetical protein